MKLKSLDRGLKAQLVVACFLDNQLSNEAQNHENSNVPKHAKWWHALGPCSFCLPLVLLSEGFAVLKYKLEIWSRTRKRKSRKMRC